MKILLTNDDGIEAKGINLLAEVLSKDIDNEIWIIAPKYNQSGVSHSFSFKSGIPIEKIRENVYSFEAFPSDCVITGLRGGIFKSKPDIVISGINSDYNIGTDVIYSGTCGAARQASLYGVPSVAVSVGEIKNYTGNGNPYYTLAEFIRKNLLELKKLCGKKTNPDGSLDYYVNVNAKALDSYKAAKFASFTYRDYGDQVVVTEKDGKLYSNFVGGQIKSFGDEKNEESLVSKDFISISLLHTNPVYEKMYGDELSRFVL